MAAAEGDPPIPALENHVAGDESSLVVVRVRRAGLLRELPRCHRLGLSFRPLPLSGSLSAYAAQGWLGGSFSVAGPAVPHLSVQQLKRAAACRCR